jgi:acetyl esterase/lipase
MIRKPYALLQGMFCILSALTPCVAIAAPATPAPAASGLQSVPAPDEPDAIALRQDAAGGASTEIWTRLTFGGHSQLQVRNVTHPTLTPVLPDPAKATGLAVIVAPGGGFFELSIDGEGYDVAHWLADHGIAAFVLKYRLDPTPADTKAAYAVIGARMQAAIASNIVIDTPQPALDDALAAVSLVRARAAQWHVDPARVGFLGFSAGAMTALSVGLVSDAAARPNFIAPIYPPMRARSVPADAPPMFLAIALDDPLFMKAGQPLALIESWRAAKVPVEAHLFGRGSHGFGFAGTSAATHLWIDEFYAWLKDRKLISAQ